MNDSFPAWRSMRLRGFDYSRPGGYFVTICTYCKRCLLGSVHQGAIRLTAAGHLVQEVWHELPNRFPTVHLDAFVVMPNHIHGILVLVQERAASRASQAIPRVTLGGVIDAFKSISTVHVNRCHGRAGQALWQRNYYDHIIRSSEDWSKIRRYILENPLRWEFDRENLHGRKAQVVQAALAAEQSNRNR
jgi:putative transposase